MPEMSRCSACVGTATPRGFASAWAYRHERRDDETFEHIALLYYGWGLLWWIGNGLHEFGRFLGDSDQPDALLAFANVLLSIAQFAEPVLFGRIVDLLSKAQATGVAPQWSDLVPLAGAWVGFGLFTITGGVLVALHADRLSHRRRLATMANYFEHVLELPLAEAARAHHQVMERPALGKIVLVP